jgi:hypothetical protein
VVCVGLRLVECEGVGLGHTQPRLDLVEQLADALGGAVEELVAPVQEVDLDRAIGRVGLLDLLVVALAGSLERPRANIRVVARVDDLRGESKRAECEVGSQRGVTGVRGCTAACERVYAWCTTGRVRGSMHLAAVEFDGARAWRGAAAAAAAVDAAVWVHVARPSQPPLGRRPSGRETVARAAAR